MFDLWANDEQERRDHEKRVAAHAAEMQAGRDLNAFEDWRAKWANAVTKIDHERGAANPGWDIGIAGPDVKQGAALLIAYAAHIQHTELIGDIATDDAYAESARQLMILALAGKPKPLQASLTQLFATGKEKGQWHVLKTLQLLTDTFQGDGIATRLMKASMPENPLIEQDQESPGLDLDQNQPKPYELNPQDWTIFVQPKRLHACFPHFKTKSTRERTSAWGRIAKDLRKAGLLFDYSESSRDVTVHRSGFAKHGGEVPVALLRKPT